MTDDTADTPQEKLEPTPGAGNGRSDAESGRSSPRRRRWLRRLGLVGAGLVITALALRVVLWLALPSILDRAARAYGLRCEYEDLSLTLITGDLELWRLQLTPDEGGDRLIDLEYCRGDVHVGALLRGRLVVRRLEVDGIDIVLDRAEDGSFPALGGLVDAVRKMAEKKEEPAVAATEEEAPRELDLTVPLQLDAFRFQDCHVFLNDSSLSPPAETRLDLDVGLSDIGSPKRRTRFHLTLASPRVFGRLRLEGELQSRGQNLEAEVRVLGRGLRPVEQARYLEASGLRPTTAFLSMDLTARVELEPAAAPAAAPGADPPEPGSESRESTALAGRISLEGVSLRADNDEQLALDHAEVVIESLAPRELRVARVSLEGGRALLTRELSGAPIFAGIQILRAPGPEPEAAKPPAAERPTGTPAAATESPTGVAVRETVEDGTGATPETATETVEDGMVAEREPTTRPAFVWSVGETALRDFRFTGRDRVIAADHEQSFELEELVLSEIRSDRAAEPVRFRGELTAPGLVESLRIEGESTPLAPRKNASLSVSGAGVTARAAAPYLEGLGIQPALQSGRFSCALEANLSGGGDAPLVAGLSLRDVVFADTGDLFTFQGVEVSGVEISPALDRFVIDRVEVSGPGFSLGRETSGVVEGLGFRWDPRRAPAGDDVSAAPENEVALTRAVARDGAASREAAAARVEPPVEASATADLSWLPRVELRRFVWRGQPIRFTDQAVTPPASIELADYGLQLENVVLEPGLTGAAPIGELTAWLSVPGMIEELTVSGAGDPSEGEAGIRLQVLGKGITGRAIAPYLDGTGLETALTGGQLEASVRAALRKTENGVVASLRVEDATFVDSGRELAGVAGLNIEGVSVQAGKLHIEAIEVDAPRTVARRTRGREVSAAVSRSGGLPHLHLSLPPIELERFRLAGAVIRWRDELVDPAVDASLVVDASLDGLDFADGARPARFDAGLRVPGSLERLAITGDLLLTPSQQSLEATMEMSGLRAGPLAVYLPRGTRLALVDGRLGARLHATHDLHEGGHHGRLSIEDVVYRDGPEGPPLLAVNEVRADIARYDPHAGVIDVEELSVAGLRTALERSPDGEWLALGLGVRPPDPESAPAEGEAPAGDRTGDASPVRALPVQTLPVQEAPGAAGAGDPVVRSPEAPVDSTGARADSAASATPEEPPRARPERPVEWPRVRLGRLDLQLERFTATDHARPESESLVLSALRLRNLEEIRLLGEDPDSQPPVLLELTGSIEPLIDSMVLRTETAPFASTPLLKCELDARGVRGDGLTRLAPELKGVLDGSNLTDGQARGRLELALNAKRRHALDFDLREGFGLDVLVEDVAFQSGDAGRIWAGLDRAEIDVARVDPEGGVHVRRIELATPRAYVSREADGIHVLGLVITDPTRRGEGEEEQERGTGVQQQGQAGGGEEEGNDPEARTASRKDDGDARDGDALDDDAARGERPRIRTRERSEEAGATARERAPEIRIDEVLVSGLDFTVVDETVEPRMALPLNDLDVEVRGVTTRALEEPLSVRLHALVTAGKVTLPVRESESEAVEERAVFEEVATSGRLALYPEPKGWLKLGVSSLDLASLKGIAREMGFELHDGVFDTGVDLRFRGDRTVAASTRLIFTDLRIEEPADGPISRYLSLPVPLDASIFTLRDEDGSLEIPLDFESGLDGIGTGQVIAAGVGALSRTIANAIASSPIRVAGALSSLVTGKEEEETSGAPIALDFEPGATAFPEAHAARLAPLLERLREEEELVLTLRHGLGSGDLAIAATRANPSRRDCLDLLARLRQRREELLARRAVLAAETRAAHATGDRFAAAAGGEKLRAVGTELGETERALDGVLEHFRPGAERQATRRTRDACIAIGAARLRGVREGLHRDGGPDLEGRIRIVRPRYAVAKERQQGAVTITPGVRKAGG